MCAAQTHAFAEHSAPARPPAPAARCLPPPDKYYWMMIRHLRMSRSLLTKSTPRLQTTGPWDQTSGWTPKILFVNINTPWSFSECNKISVNWPSPCLGGFVINDYAYHQLLFNLERNFRMLSANNSSGSPARPETPLTGARAVRTMDRDVTQPQMSSMRSDTDSALQPEQINTSPSSAVLKANSINQSYWEKVADWTLTDILIAKSKSKNLPSQRVI